MSRSERAHLLPVASGRQVVRVLWRMLAGRRLQLIGITALFLAESATAVVFPLVIGVMVDTLIETGASGSGFPAAFWWQMCALAAAAVLAGLLAWAGWAWLARVAETLIAQLREAYVASALNLPRAVIERAGTGDVVTRASDDVAHVSETLPDVLPRVAVSTFTILLVAAGLAALNPLFLAGFAITIPAYALIARWYLRVAPPVYAAERAAQSERGQWILGTLTALPTVATQRLESRRLDAINAAAWQTVRWAMRERIVQNRLFGRLNATEAIGLLAVLGAGVWLAFDGAASAGEVTSAALLFLRTIAPITALLFVMDELQSSLASLCRLVGVIALRPAVVARPLGLADAEGCCANAASADGVVVRLEDVSFAYPGGEPVLHGVSLELRAGETLAVVGATGSGKSTLAALIAGVHQPVKGRVVRTVPEQRIVTVAQESHVFATTVRDNLTLAAPGTPEWEVRGALSLVRADALAGLADGLETRVGYGGHELPASQAQQLALARVALADPAVVVLDEATAGAGGLDAIVLDRAARVVTRGRAGLVIAHRLTQAQAADRIVVLDAGRIIETGAHDELVASDGAYAELWAAWSAGSGQAAGDRSS